MDQSKHKSDFVKFFLSARNDYRHQNKDKGLQTNQDARFYALPCWPDASPYPRGPHWVVHFPGKHKQNIDCGGGYLKLFLNCLDQTDVHGDSAYNTLFGPDICSAGTWKVQVLFNCEGKNMLDDKDMRCKDHEFTRRTH